MTTSEVILTYLVMPMAISCLGTLAVAFVITQALGGKK